MTTALASASGSLHHHLQLRPIAMEARQFHHHHDAVPSFDDVMEACIPDDDVIKQESPPVVSPRQPTVSPHDDGFSPPPASTTPIVTTVNDAEEEGAFVSYRLDHDDSGGSSNGSGVQQGIDQGIFDADVAAAVDLCLSGTLRLPYLPSQQRTDASTGPSAVRHGNGATGPRPSPGQCKVCGDEATGMYFGALVCVPCKTFFLRYAGDGFSFVCKANKDCDISVTTRTQCKYCRYQKCLRAGMYRRVRPAQVQLSAGQQLCVVCHDVANGIHFGAITCEGCKKFFRRGLTEHATYACKSGQNCVINPRTRNSCRYCRFQTCLRAGMSREAIQMGRPSKICGSDPTGSNMTSAHPQPQQRIFHSSSSVVPGGAIYLGGHAAPRAAWRPNDDHLSGLPYNWTIDPVTGQVHRRASEAWNSQYSDGGGGRLLAEGGSLEPSPKRRHSDSLASSSSPYQFSPGGSSCADLAHPGAPHSGSSEGSQRSRQSSMSSQDAVAYHGGTLWGSSHSPATTNVAGPPASMYGMHRTSGGEMLQRVTGNTGGSSSSQQEVYMHWNLPPITSTTTPKPEDTGRGTDAGAFHSREMSDVIETIIRQQQHPTTTLASDLTGLHSTNATLQHRQQQQLASGTVDNLPPLLFSQSAATTSIGASTQGCFIPSFPSLDQPALSSMDTASTSSISIDTNEWVNHLTDDRSAATAGRTDIPCSLLSDEGPDAEIETQVQSSMSYWLHPDLPDENVMLADRHWDVLNQVVPAYNRFVQFGSNVNRKLKIKFDEWSKDHPNGNKQERAAWIQSEVIPIYTLSSITYFRSLPGFNELSQTDQGTLIRLGQSQSRILVAALHWYDPEENDFRHFLSWRIMPPGQMDHFRQKLIDYSKRVSTLELDPIEAALLNVLVIVASDYPGLESTALIEEYRRQILCTFRAYTTAKFGTPNTRLETLFQYIPDVRRLGLWHYKMTTDPSLGVAQQRQS